MPRLERRQFLRTGAMSAVIGLSGCLMGGPPTAESEAVVEWRETYGDPDVFTSFFGLTGTNDGGFIAAGSQGSDTQSQQALLVKVDDEGDEEWSKTFGGEGWQWFNLAIEFDSGYIAGGGSQSFDSNDVDKAWLVGIDNDGDEKWQEMYGNQPYTESIDLAAAGPESVLVVGQTSPTRSSEDWKAWVLKADNDGDVAWRKTFRPDSMARARLNGVASTERGFLLTGETRPDESADPMGYALAIDDDGDLEWSETYDEGRFWRATTDGDRYVISGTSGQLNEREAWLLSIDSEGSEMWSETYDEEDDAAFTDIVAFDGDGLLDTLFGGGSGRYLAVGWVDDDPDEDDPTAWLARVTESGEVKDSWSWDEDASSRLWSVEQAGETYVLAGALDDDGTESDEDMWQGILVRSGM